jgi:hypothetical protein
MSPADPGVTTDLPVPTSLISVLIIAVTVLAGVVVFLFKYYSGQHDKVALERSQWAVDRAKLEDQREMDRLELRAEYETKHRMLSEENAKALRDLFDRAREHENVARREYLANMEVLAAEAAKANEKIGLVLEKALDRFVGSSSHRKG